MTHTGKLSLLVPFVVAAAFASVACTDQVSPTGAGDPIAEEETPAEEEASDPSTSSSSGGSSSGGKSSSSSSSSGGGKSSTSSGGTTTPPAPVRPAWLVSKAYTTGYKLDSNVYHDSVETGIRFGGAPTYAYEELLNKKWSKSGTWEVKGTVLELTDNYGAKEFVDLAANMSANCRVLDRRGEGRAFTYAAVAGCPFKQVLTTAECAKAGKWEKVEKYESGSGSSYSSSTYTTTYDLQPDGFINYQYSSFKFLCYGATCKDTSSRSAPLVGRWWLDGTTLKSDATSVNVAGFTFTKSSSACVK